MQGWREMGLPRGGPGLLTASSLGSSMAHGASHIPIEPSST